MQLAGQRSLASFFSVRYFIAFTLIFAFAVVHSATMTMTLLALLAWTVRGPVHAIQAMSIVAILRSSNPSIAVFSSISSILFWAVILLGCLVFLLRTRRVPTVFWVLFMFFVTAILTSIVSSAAVDVSISKIVSFFIVAGSFLLVSSNLKVQEAELLTSWFVSLALAVVCLSLFTLISFSLAFGHAGMGMRGIFNHPQALAIFLVPFASWLIVGRFVSARTGGSNLSLVVVTLVVVIIVLTKARTAMLATFMSVFLATLFHLFKPVRTSLRKKQNELLALLLVIITCIGLFSLSEAGSELIRDIVFKGSHHETIGEAFDESRGAGIAEHLKHFAENPFIGIGFGVYEFGVFGGEERVVRIFGIPISAPAEKGFAFTSVLEETGIIGGLLFYLFVYLLVRESLNAYEPEVAALMLGAILVNFGEAVIFSPGGLGLYMWVVIALSLARSHRYA